ncbi:GRIM-19 [Thamnocephalis sphaerospora]|uniref:NADH dehydrogenase [ubiquinone] 1 alpha subcomplex subunit 13 n=1 Tax=Thamnocephalis sphaerospora TaxID=78915 RepID=A0A4V1IW20_9FUNG|nr:GRIM-19 [Thamnocephalis sphaerospora]|eukprot:RKP06029.1 GRIM-19 [Thamnocephalis sphaerospora]
MSAQDLPRPGGYPSIRYQRNMPARGPSGFAIFVGTALVCGFGFWRAIEGIKERRELRREKLWSRLHLVPLLQAETDRDTYRRHLALNAEEAEIMKDVEGWKVGDSVYNTDRYVPRAVFFKK